MRADALAKIVEKADCRVFGHEDAGNVAHREVLAALIRGFDHPDATVLCEPSLARKSTRPPDVVVVDPLAGVHVVEVKGVALDQIEAIGPGGMLTIRYGGLINPPKNPVVQARNVMFDIRDAAARSCDGELTLSMRYWAILPMIGRSAWFDRWGDGAFAPPELLFDDDLPGLAETIRESGRRALENGGLRQWPADQLVAVWRAFGDSSALYHLPEEREARRIPEGTLGELFDDAAEGYKALSDEQQRLSSQDWSEGPRLVRGVAGSGKTIVLATNLARRLSRARGDGEPLFEEIKERPRLLAVCYNRTLVPFIRQKIDVAYRQRTGRPLPEDAVEVWHYNRLLWHLSRKGLWRYHKIDDLGEAERVGLYLAELEHVRRNQPDLLGAVAYDAIYVDEGQDFLEDDFRLLKDLCRTTGDGEPSLFIFYDDAQNFLGRRRPNWKSLGLNVAGRSSIMTQCFRSTRPIIEASFNVLYGRHADDGAEVPTRDFGDIPTLQEKGLIEEKDGRFEVRFAVRDGIVPPRLTIAPDARAERDAIVDRLRWLIEEQKVRPEDILVLARSWQRVSGIAGAIREAALPSIAEVHVARDEQDRNLRRRGCLPLSTVASAKGYDSYCVLLTSANEFPADVAGRAAFYVGCTRAIESLEVFAYRKAGLVVEFERALGRGGGVAADANEEPSSGPDPPPI